MHRTIAKLWSLGGRLGLVVGLALFFISVASPVHAKAKTRVRWKKVEVRDGDDARRVAKSFERMLIHKSRQAKWGKGERLHLTAKVTKLAWEERDDVLRVTVTVVARIEGLRSAKSHIRIGGHPKKRRDLEGEALEIVAGGLVTRLSDIARKQAEAEKKAAEEDADDE